MNAIAWSTKRSTSVAEPVVLDAALGPVDGAGLEVAGDVAAEVVVGDVAVTVSSRNTSAATPAAINMVTTPMITATITVDGPGARAGGGG